MSQPGRPRRYQTQPVSDSTSILLVASQFVPKGSVLQSRSQDQEQARQDRRDQRPHGPQRQGHAQDEEASGDILRMTDDGIGTGVDDGVTTVGLDADGRLEELVHRLRPGHARQSGDQQDIPDPADPPRNVRPVIPPVVQGCYREDRDHRRDQKAQQQPVPALCSLMTVDTSGDDIGVDSSQVQRNHDRSHHDHEEEQPAPRPRPGSGRKE
jgi:hypothetical protein